jgi:3-oxoacyl-[acyl-carrier-protein] synthase II
VSGVTITGLGAVGPFGVGIDALAASWARGGPDPVAVDRSAGYHRPGGARRALLAGGLDLSALVPSAQARRMALPGRFALAAARLALADAGLAAADRAFHRDTAIVVGTAFGPAAVTERLLDQILRQGPETASPALFTESVANATAAQVAIALGAHGANLAITAREASDLLALAAGARLLATGAAERALVLVVDEMTPLLHSVLDRFRALAHPEEGGHEVARPFDRRRSGLLAAEGGAALLLERAADARARGRIPHARLRACVRAFDSSAPAWGFGRNAARLAATLGRGIERSGVASTEIDLVAAAAGGTRDGDRLEAGILRSLFGDALPPLLAPRGVLGAWGGAALAAGVLAASGRGAPETPGFAQEDSALGVRPYAAPSLPPPRRTLLASLSAGGAAAWALLEREQPPASGRV